MLLNYILWNGHINIFNWDILGFQPRWYGLLFVLGFGISHQIGIRILQKDGLSIQETDRLTLYVFLATVIGARLGHILFYDFNYFFTHPLEVLLPFTFSPSFQFIGYAGLASHGAALGILISVYLFVYYRITFRLMPWKLKIKKNNGSWKRFFFIIDRIAIVVCLAGCFIRIGNFMNSEIIGKPTSKPYGMVFTSDVIHITQSINPSITEVKVKKRTTTQSQEGYQPVNIEMQFLSNQKENIDQFLQNYMKSCLVTNTYMKSHIYEVPDTPLSYTLIKNKQGYIAKIATWGIARHPAQLYEACSLLPFFLLFLYWWKRKKNIVKQEGKLTACFLIFIFGIRFFYEFIKENQVDFENHITLNMGQWLSVPLVLLGICLFFLAGKKNSTNSEN